MKLVKRFGIDTSATLCGFLLLASIGIGGMLAVSEVLADDVVDEINITVPVSCSFAETVSDNNTYNATVRNNEYEDDIGHTTFKVFCNDSNGYSLYAVGYGEDTFGNTEMVYQGSATPTPSNIVTGTATSGSTSNWAMKMNVVAGPYAPTLVNGFGSYRTIPSTYTKVATFPSQTDNNTGSSVQSSYAIFVSATQPAGTYTGKVRYTLVHPDTEVPAQPQTSASGKICYYANASDAIGTMGCQDVASTVTLLASNFSRTGYGFAGWSDAFDYATNANAHFYGPQEDLSIPDTSIYTGEGKGLSLYAVWVKSQGSIQDTSKVASVCNALVAAPTDGTANLASVSALTDQRDNQTYAIAKLADGKCWMIENLRLQSTAGHNSDGTLAQGYGTSSTYGNFSGLADVESTGFSSTSANSLYSNDGSNNTINIGTSNYPEYRMPRYNNTNTSARASSPTANTGSMYSYGNYYTWHAAIADLTYNSTDNSSVTNTSLCPAGWHLPTGGLAYASGNTGGVNVTGDTSTFREFYNLGYKTMDEVKTAYEDTPNSGYAYYSSNTTNTAGNTATKAFRSFPNNFLYSGYFSTSSAIGRGSSGYYWSSAANSYSYSYDLGLGSSNVRPGTYNYGKYYGLSIRCTTGT